MTAEKAARLAAIRAANALKAAASDTPAPGVALADSGEQGSALRAAQRSGPVAPAAGESIAEFDALPPVSFGTLFALLFGAVGGAFVAAILLPRWLPGLTTSLLGAEPKAYWYLARSSALVAFALLWLSMALGLSITSKAARLWIGGPTLFDVHQFTSLLALAFGLFHSLILLGDSFMRYTVVELLLPFGSQTYRPVAVGLGQVALYLLALVALSFYARSWIGRRAWRIIHYLSFGVYLLVLAHGIASGSDTGQPVVQALYWASGGSLLFLTLYRILIRRAAQPGQAHTQRSKVSSGTQPGATAD